MSSADVMIHAVDAALQKAEEAFDCVRVNLRTPYGDAEDPPPPKNLGRPKAKKKTAKKR